MVYRAVDKQGLLWQGTPVTTLLGRLSQSGGSWVQGQPELHSLVQVSCGLPRERIQGCLAAGGQLPESLSAKFILHLSAPVMWDGSTSYPALVERLYAKGIYYTKSHKVVGHRAQGLGVIESCLPQVGSFGNGTVLRSTTDVELVAFLSCFHSFQEEAKHHHTILRLMQKKMFYCQDLLDLGLDNLGVTEGVPSGLIFTIRTRETWEPITVTIIPAYRALGKGNTQVLHGQPASPRRL